MTNIRLHRWLLLAALLSFASDGLSQTASTANTTVFLRLQGEKTGVITGEVVQKGREGTHKLLAYSHEIVSPRDPASGLPTGKRQHQPFRVVKLINRASPILLQVLATNERLTTVTIDLWVPAPTGVEVKMLTYTLTNAQLVSSRPWMPNKSDSATASYPPAEELAFIYQKISVTYHDGGITGEDDWDTTAF
jgi:type VI secretion system secreted protein Hcp